MRLKIFTYLIFFSAAFASDPAEGGHGDGGWMEKWLSFDPGLFLWTIVTFLVVLAILRWKAWGPLMSALDNREKKIRDALMKADEAKEEAAKMSDKYDQMVKSAQAEAQKIVANGKTTGDRLRADIEKSAQSQAEEILIKAKEQIETERERAIQDIRSAVIEISLAAAEKVLEKNLSTEDNRKLIVNTISRVGQA